MDGSKGTETCASVKYLAELNRHLHVATSEGGEIHVAIGTCSVTDTNRICE